MRMFDEDKAKEGMICVRSEVYEKLISDVKSREPEFYQVLMAALVSYNNHHYYHFKILDSFRGAVATGFLPVQYQSAIDVLEAEYKKFVYSELFGTWIGTENDIIAITLELNSTADFKVFRRWNDRKDGQIFQEFKALNSVMFEFDELIILNLFACEKKMTKIKLVLHPSIMYHKKLLGSMFVFQEDTCSICTNVIFEKAENGT